MTYSKATSQTGFTLIELVSVMVLLGILAVIAVPTFTGSDDFSAYSAQDQIIAGARMAQQRAMYDRAGDDCYYLEINNNVLTVLWASGGSITSVGPSAEWRNGIVIDSAVTIANQNIFFDGLGNVLGGCPGIGSQIGSELKIAIGSPATLNVCVNPVGYIYAC